MNVLSLRVGQSGRGPDSDSGQCPGHEASYRVWCPSDPIGGGRTHQVPI